VLFWQGTLEPARAVKHSARTHHVSLGPGREVVNVPLPMYWSNQRRMVLLLGALSIMRLDASHSRARFALRCVLWARAAIGL
jgi:hypothetical protein